MKMMFHIRYIGRKKVLNEMSAETIELANNYTQKRFVDLIRNTIVNGYRNTCADPRNCYTGYNS